MILQQQIDPLESWIERAAAEGAKIVLLGDFNRNLWHELRDQRPARTDATGTSSPRPAGVLSRSLIEEVADGQPADANLRISMSTARSMMPGSHFAQRRKSAT
ncbi:hypothetical protein [Rhizobium mulingense]|uniref:hypothetical protein n=1 Tax=Rhizobium mulingense TaxID=3031128 RepID=UPI002B49FD70|nr:hypothetical protein [Rhizobium sp. MJ21]